MKIKNQIFRLTGLAVMVGVSLRVNPYVFSKSDRITFALIKPTTLIDLLAVDILCLLGIGLIILRWDALLKIFRFSGAFARWIAERLYIRAALVCSLLAYCYFCSSAEYIGCNVSSPVVLFVLLWPALASGIILSAALRRGGGKLKSGWTLFALLYVAIAICNIVSLQNGGGQLDFRMLGWISSESVAQFLRPSIFIAPFIAGLALWIAARWHRLFPAITGRAAIVAVLVGLAMGTVNLAKQVVTAGSIFQSMYERIITRVELDSLIDLSDPLFLVSGQVRKKLTSGNRDIDMQTYVSMVRQVRGLSASAPANPNPPKRIVMIFVESFSLNFSKKYNPALPTTLTPNLDALSDATVEPLRFRTISSPTTPGLGTDFCSVPNSDLANNVAYNCSVVRRLKDAGWHTVMFESPVEDYDSGTRRFAQIGFAELYGARYQSAHGNGNSVKQWGTFDKVTLSSIASYLAAHRNEKLFIAGLTIDTHLPAGRTDYGSLTYPDAPTWIVADRAHLLLRSVFRIDHDLSDFVEAVRKIDGLEDTVMIITADHSLPPFPELNNRLGLTQSRFEEIPFLMIGKKVPTIFPSPTDSQLDTAPTLAYLAGVSPDPRWWGHNLFQPAGPALPLYQYDWGRGMQFNPKTGSFDTPVSPEILRLLESYPNVASAQGRARATGARGD